MREKRDRFFALFGAILFLVTASTLTILVVWQMASNGNASTADNNKNTGNASQTACEDNQAEPTFDKPEVFKPEGDVTKVEATDLEVGTGDTIRTGDCIVTKYFGSLAKDGTVFDENFTKPTGFAFNYNMGSVVPGFDEGLQGMKVGGMRRIVIPSNKGYGAQANGAIPANSDLVFVVKVLRVQKGS